MQMNDLEKPSLIERMSCECGQVLANALDREVTIPQRFENFITMKGMYDCTQFSVTRSQIQVMMQE